MDPSAWRLSMARGDNYDYVYRGRRYCDSYTRYYDLAAPNFYSYSYERLAVVAVEPSPEGEDSLLLRLDPPLDDYTCLLSEYAADDGVGGIMVHHSGRGIPDDSDVRDKDGNALEDIAPHWVLSDNPYTYRSGLFPAMPHWLPIPCPD
jgi:hypothetical protein